MNSISISDASRDFSHLVHRIIDRREDILVTDGGVPLVILSPVDEACTGKELARKWAKIPHMDADEAESFEADLAAARNALPPIRSKWD